MLDLTINTAFIVEELHRSLGLPEICLAKGNDDLAMRERSTLDG